MLTDEEEADDVEEELPLVFDVVVEDAGADEEVGARGVTDAAVDVSEVSIGTVVLGEELVTAGPPSPPSELAQELMLKVTPVTRAGSRRLSENTRD